MKGDAEIQVIVHEEDGMFWAESPDMPGLFASGESMDELLESLGEALALYLDIPAVNARLSEPRPVAATEHDLEYEPA